MFRYLRCTHTFTFSFFAASLSLVCVVGETAFAQLTLEQKCKSKKMGDVDGVDQSNPECSHDRLLKEGNNVYGIYYAHAQKKLELVKDKFKNKTATPADLTSDGTCLQGDDETKCIERLSRAALDAKLRTRDTLLKNNNARTEMMGGKSGESVGKGFIGGSGANQPPTNETVLKDFNKAAQQSTADKAKALLVAPQQVSFIGQKPKGTIGDTLQGGANLQKAETVDIQNIDPNVAAGMKSGTTLDVSTNTQDAGLNNKLDNAIKTKKLDQQFAKDDQDINAVKLAAPGGNNKSTSFEAFKSVMGDLSKQAVDQDIKNGGKGSAASIDSRDATINIVDPTRNVASPPPAGPSGASGKPPQSQPLDKDILTDPNL